MWAYPEGPVTGDYDLWMVSPYFTDWKNHTTAFIFKDEHTKEQHAGSANEAGEGPGLLANHLARYYYSV